MKLALRMTRRVAKTQTASIASRRWDIVRLSVMLIVKSHFSSSLFIIRNGSTLDWLMIRLLCAAPSRLVA
jgi:hypothetical protein